MTKNRISELFAVAMHCGWVPHVLGNHSQKPRGGEEET